ncbi:MAG: DNA polymerase III subunit gamma/tau [Acidimicrobiales bacterium]
MDEYQSLYRRYRPQRFVEVRGQDHVVNALRHAVRDNHVAHAYLFSGPRGTGKTSTARILAKALNCKSPVEGEPCGVCDSCLDITRGASFDVHELDAASNNGVEAMRDLVARASLATPGRWKVYIVDEVHMLSQAASNALLKTLEEPPDHVVFVLATTDPQKVLPTIRSRTQHYEFRLLDADVLALLLAEVARDAKLELPESAVEAAVRRGRGSARDALSALDQVVASGVVEDDSPFLHELLVSLAERDTARALQAIESGLVAGRDAPRIAAGLLDELRGQFLAVMAPGLARQGEPPVAGGQASAAASAHSGLLLGPARSVRAMEVLGNAMVAMRDALDARITLEVAIVRLTHPEADDDAGALLERIERLERRIQDLAGAAAGAPPPQMAASVPPLPASSPPAPLAPVPSPTGGTGGAASPGEAATREDPGSQPALGAFASGSPTFRALEPGAPRPGQALAPVVAPANLSTVTEPPPESDLPPPSRDELVEAWGDHVLNQLRPRVRAVYAVGRFLATEGATAIMALPNATHVERAEEHSAEVAEALGRYFGRPVQLRLVAERDVGTSYLPAASSGLDARETSAAEPGADGPSASARPSPSGARRRAPDARSASLPTDPSPAVAAPRTVASPDPDGVAEELLGPDDLDPLGEQVPGDALSWAEERLMEIFPGAEEV